MRDKNIDVRERKNKVERSMHYFVSPSHSLLTGSGAIKTFNAPQPKAVYIYQTQHYS